jgi:hypothetical protein
MYGTVNSTRKYKTMQRANLSDREEMKPLGTTYVRKIPPLTCEQIVKLRTHTENEFYRKSDTKYFLHNGWQTKRLYTYMHVLVEHPFNSSTADTAVSVHANRHIPMNWHGADVPLHIFEYIICSLFACLGHAVA